MNNSLTIVVAASMLCLTAAPLSAQLFYIGLRGGAGIPAGTFAKGSASGQSAFQTAAKAGFGYGLDAGVGLGQFGVYAGFDRINFNCETQTCDSNGEYKLAGASAGLRVSGPSLLTVTPWVKAGVTFNELTGTYGGSGSGARLTSDRAPGYELGAGIDIPILTSMFSLTPQVRYVGQNFKYKVPGVTSPDGDNQGTNYYTFDLGFRLRSPF